MSSTPTISASVEILLLIFFLIDVEYIETFKIDIVDPVWLFMYGFTENDMSTHHFTICSL